MRLILKFPLLVLHNFFYPLPATHSFQSRRKTHPILIILSFFLLIFFCKPTDCQAVTLTWTANDPIENVTGYKIYYGSASRQYSKFKNVGKVTSCKLEEVITTLVAGKTYYLAAKAKSATSESDFSTEVVYTHSTVPGTVKITKITDTDGDGISDVGELNLYGTDPTSTDSDLDGISDNKELIYWGALWNEDFDGDGIINLIDWDSDGDGISDGEEIAQGTDIPNTQQTVYEDGEDGKISGWDIYDNDPAGASITNVFDSDKQSRVIEVSGYDIQNGFRLRNDDLSNWQNTSQFIAKWSMKFTGYYTIYIDVETTAGQRYIYYTPIDDDRLGTGQYVHHGLGSDSTNGEWITITRNLEQDFQEAQPEAVIIKVNAILIRGNGRIDDILLQTFL